MTLENERIKLQRMERQLLILADALDRQRAMLERAVCPECGRPHVGIAHLPIDKLPRRL